MRKLPHILIAISLLILVAGLLYPTIDEWIHRPSDPEAVIESIVVDRRVANIKMLYRDDFPIDVLIRHLNDERAMRITMYATQGPNRVWMLCNRVVNSRLGLEGDPAISGKWLFPMPDSFPERTEFVAWWEASSKDELLIRHEMATWQLAEMEKSADRFGVHLPFKRQQVAETRRHLDAR